MWRPRCTVRGERRRGNQVKVQYIHPAASQREIPFDYCRYGVRAAVGAVLYAAFSDGGLGSLEDGCGRTHVCLISQNAGTTMTAFVM